MDDDILADLKQFIAATVRQEVSDLATKADIEALDDKLSARIKAGDDKLSAQLNELQASVAEALDTTNDAVHEQLQDYGTRIGRLEHRVA